MASRSFKPAPKVLNTGAVDLCGKWVVGATGAVGTTSFKGVTSVTRNSAGQYTLLLSNSYANLISAHVTPIVAAAQKADLYWVVEGETVSNASTPSIVIQFYAGGGTTETDPPNPSTILVTLRLSNSSLGIA